MVRTLHSVWGQFRIVVSLSFFIAALSVAATVSGQSAYKSYRNVDRGSAKSEGTSRKYFVENENPFVAFRPSSDNIRQCSHEIVEEGSASCTNPANVYRDRCCESESCFEESTNCCPNWTAWGGALFFNRTGLPTQRLLVNGVPLATANTIFDANQLDFGWQTGFEVGLRHNNNALGRPVEARFFHVGDWSDSFRTVTAAPNAALVAYRDAPLGLAPLGPGNTTTTLGYDSRLYSVELNVLNQPVTDSVSWLIGFRHIGLSDKLNAHQADNNVPINVVDQSIGTDNLLFGGQIGAVGQRAFGERFGVDWFSKAGVYYNNVSNDFRYNASFFPPPTRMDGDESTASFATEAGINLNYQVNQMVKLRAGYQVLWLNSVAVASEQASVNSATNLLFNPAANAVVDDNDDALFHGAFAGIEFNY